MTEGYKGKRDNTDEIIWDHNELRKTTRQSQLGGVEQVGEDNHDALATHSSSVVSGPRFLFTRRGLLDRGEGAGEVVLAPREPETFYENLTVLFGQWNGVRGRNRSQIFNGVYVLTSYPRTTTLAQETQLKAYPNESQLSLVAPSTSTRSTA